MDESLRVFSDALSDPDPQLTLASMLCEAVGVIRRILVCESPNHAKLAAISSTLDEFAPPPPPGPPPDGTTPGGVARDIAGQLACHPAPATAVLERFAREPVHVAGSRVVIRPASDAEQRRLRTDGETVHYRTGQLVTASGIHVAAVQLAVIPARLPGALAARLGGPEPFGRVAGRHMRRIGRAAAAGADGDWYAVRSTALLEVDGLNAGIASEWVLREFCDHVAALGGGHGG